MLRLRSFKKQTWFIHVFILLLTRFCEPSFSEFLAPSRVIGVFNPVSSQIKCAPGIAASFAVELFNPQHPINFSYENIQEDHISRLASKDSIAMLNNSIVITEDSYLCENLSDIIINLSSFLVCYGTPTTKTLESLESHYNTFLSQPDPNAVLPCLFRLIKQIIDEYDNTSLATFIYDEDHPFRQVLTGLQWNLRSAYPYYDEVFSEIPLSVQGENQTLLEKKQLEHATFINAILNEKEARNLLCESIQDAYSNENRSLIFVGLSNRHWLDFNDSQNSYNATCGNQRQRSGKTQRRKICSVSELRTAAEGHLILEYPHPAWINSSANEHVDISITKGILRERLRNCSRVTLTEYDKAPLEFDSVWAILKAIHRASRENNGFVSGESVSQALVSRAFTGLTGEIISFIKYKNGKNSGCVRNTNETTINIYRFELGDYVPIAIHFNANNSFYWMHELRPGGRHTWKPTRPECPDFLLQAGRDILVMSLLLSLLLTVLLLGIIFFCFQYFRV